MHGVLPNWVLRFPGKKFGSASTIGYLFVESVGSDTSTAYGGSLDHWLQLHREILSEGVKLVCQSRYM